MVYEIRTCDHRILYHAFLVWSIALTKLSARLAEIEKTGENVLICRHGKPVAELVPHRELEMIDASFNRELQVTEELQAGMVVTVMVC
jgi:antitoxin (DNA-binding transcriptional repressor) of toxin-antitoxin stability system